MRLPTGLRTCLLALAFAGPAAAAQADRPLVGAAPDWVVPAPADSATPAAADVPVQVLMSDQQVRITTEHVEGYVATRMKILSPQGLAALGTLSFAWNPDSDVLTVHRLAVTRDGTDQDLLGNGAAFTILRREDQLEQAILTGMLTAVLQPPGLRVGDVIDMRFTLRRRDPVVHENPDGAYLWSNTMVPNARFRALWPDSLALRWRGSSHMPAATHQQRDGWHELSYRMQDLGPLLQPTGAPGRYSALRMLELSTYADWQALSRRFGPLYAEASKLAADSPLKAEATRIRREHATPEARAAAALRFVQDEIRYVLLAMNTGGLMPAKADETLQRRFGDCKAKSALLLALLGELGIEAEVVAVSTAFGDGLDARLPGIGLFDHVLVRARIGGKTYWLDGTRQGDRVLARIRPPAYFWALPLTARGSELVQIPREPLAEPESLFTVEIDATDGVQVPAPLKAELRLTGDAAYGLKLAMDAEPAASRSEGMRAYWRGELRGAQLEEVASAFDEQLGVLTWTATGTIKMEWDPEYDTYQPHNMELGHRADFSRPRDTDAAAPYAVAFPSWVRHVEKIRLPPQSVPFTATGTDIERTIAGGEFRRTARVTGNLFTAESSYRSIAPEFPAGERAEAERVLLEMSRNNLYLKMPANYLPTVDELKAAAGETLETANEYVLRALQMQRRGMEDEALAEAKAGLAVHPGHPMLSQIQAAIHAQRGEGLLALQSLQGISSADMNAAMLNVRGKAHVLLEQPDQALKDFDAAIALDPKYFPAYEEKVFLLAGTGDRSRVQEIAEALRDASGTDPTGIRGASLIAQMGGFRELALQYADEEIAIKPSADAHVFRARLREAKADIVADLSVALKRDDLSVQRQYDASAMLLDSRWYREAADLLGQLDKDKGLEPQVLGRKGIALWKLGDKTGASADFRRAREIAAARPGSLNNLCWDKATHNVELEEALRECDAAIADQPDCAHCVDSRAFVLLRLGRVQESIAAYDQALAMNPDEASSLYGRGIAKIRSGDEEAGNLDIAAALKRSPFVRGTFDRAEVYP